MDEENQKTAEGFLRLYEITKTLRSENGCPWDKKQTPSTMRQCILEEAFEVVDAISNNDAENSKEELGDLFFNTMLTSHMFEQSNAFSLAEVFNSISEKLLRRHPHVKFENHLYENQVAPDETIDLKSTDEINQRWNEIKNTVEGRQKDCILDQVPKSFPPMLKAYKYLKKAASQGFEWPSIEEGKNKIFEELKEVDEAVEEKKVSGENQHLEEEIGDLLLSVINYARMLGVNPEVALSRGNQKFYKRYSYVEQKMKENKIPQNNEGLEKMIEFWKEAKDC